MERTANKLKYFFVLTIIYEINIIDIFYSFDCILNSRIYGIKNK